ncbi:YqcC family protein [Balneatrix alpica]|uniref:YqcC family protein n=1 Tax=Balneatrix alpica TaxID=75684 RepID=A0ABV5ZDZ8_9GAMM|nr:YqcC family protein [Balneatrix alpica]
MSDTRTQVYQGLQDLQQALQHANLWSAEPPSEEAMNSQAPFCCDLMSLEQWLQWIFIPRMQAILDAHAKLPANCAIQPMAEESFKDYRADVTQIINVLGRLDHAINQL